MERHRIDLVVTGRKIRQLMDERGLSVRDVRRELRLASVQSIYHWLSGRSLPSIDNLCELSALLRVPMDVIICIQQLPGQGEGTDEEMNTGTDLAVFSEEDFCNGLNAGTVFHDDCERE